MKRRAIILLCTAACLLAAAPCAKGWNGLGHSAIAYIAERHLTPETRRQCRRYLKHTLPYYASWMDHWRNCPGFEHTSHWHSVPVDASLQSIRSEEDNAANQIRHACRRLKRYRRMSDSLVCDNLKYLIHMVGDMHCPSHTKYVDQPRYRSYSIFVNGRKTGSHSFWDSSPSRFHKGWTCEDFARGLDTYSEAEIAAICEGSPEEWAHGNAAAMRETFRLLPASCEYADLPEDDKARMRDISDRQIVMAGYRLAAVLNGIFDPKTGRR